MQREYAVPILGLYPVGIELNRQRQCPVELTSRPFAPVKAHALGKRNRLSPGNTDGVFFGLNLQTVLFDAGQFDDRQNVLALLENVDWRKRPLAGRLTPATRAYCGVTSISAASALLH
jgi:hypothetical protein